MNNEYTPTLEEIREVWGDRSVSREGRSTTQWRELSVIALAEFDRAINKIRAEAVRDAASGLIDWDIMYGHESETSVSKVSHANASYLMRVADDFERGGH